MPQINATAAGVICRAKDGKVLFLKRGDGGDHAGEWCLPGGGCEDGEFGETTARRELKEETGYEAGDLAPYHRGLSEDGVDFSTYLHDVAGKFSPTLNEEHTEHVWADPKEAPQPLHPGVAAMLLANDAEFKESDHPRGAGGKFGSGTGGKATPKDHTNAAENHTASAKAAKESGNHESAAAHTAAAEAHHTAASHTAHGNEAQASAAQKAAHEASAKANTPKAKIPPAGQKDPEGLKRDASNTFREAKNTAEKAAFSGKKEDHEKAVKHLDAAQKELKAAGHEDHQKAGELKAYHEKALGGSEGGGSTKEKAKSADNVARLRRAYEQSEKDHAESKTYEEKINSKQRTEEATKAYRNAKQKHEATFGKDGANDWATCGAALGVLPQVVEMLAMDWAFDKQSVRTYDDNGRLRVEQANISKANVCPYKGSEIVDYAELGLDPDKVYQLLRDPEALELGAETFNGVPVLDTHVPSTAWDHPAGKVVGTTGTDAVFEAPYLKNSLIIWTQDAIQGIESRAKQELSCGYKYRPIMEPGNYEGVKYDGRMVEILGNHVALVAAGRAGPDVIVGDHQLEKETGMTKKALSPMAQLARGALMAALRPVLAADAKLDLNVVLKDVTKKNWKTSQPAILAAIKPKLAADAELTDVIKLLDTLDKAEGVDDADPQPVDTPPAVDAGPADKIAALLKGKVDDATLAAVLEACKTAPAADADPEDKDGDEPKVTKGAMDAAIRTAVADAITTTETKTINRLNAIGAAHEVVKPYVGKLSGAYDSAEGVYRAALTTMGVKHDGIHESALRAIVEAQQVPGTKKVTQAADSAATADFEKRYPGVAAVRVI